MIQYQLKLRLTAKQEATVKEWLWSLTGVWNWAVRKVELDARDGRYYSGMELRNILANHADRLGIPGHTLQGALMDVHNAWAACFKKKRRKPKFKSNRRPLNSISFPDPIKGPKGNKISLPGLGNVRYHSQYIPDGRIKCARMVRRASGWHLCLFIDAKPMVIPHTGEGIIGIDPGFSTLLTLSNGEKIAHPRELEATAKRLSQAQRGKKKKLVARLHERSANQRKDRNHKLSRRLVAENAEIYFSADNHNVIARTMGKSVASSAHGQLRQMLAYKCLSGGRQYHEVSPKHSTMRCSACGDLSGPTGLAGLAVRDWVCCGCGAAHNRDINAAINALNTGAGTAHEGREHAA